MVLYSSELPIRVLAARWGLSSYPGRFSFGFCFNTCPVLSRSILLLLQNWENVYSQHEYNKKIIKLLRHFYWSIFHLQFSVDGVKCLHEFCTFTFVLFFLTTRTSFCINGFIQIFITWRWKHTFLSIHPK